MSKAFTKEDDTDEEPLPRLVSPLAPGTRNYLTAAGAGRLQAELQQLEVERRPALIAAAQGDSEARRELKQVEQRIAYLQESLTGAEVVPPFATDEERVRFGATVTVRDEDGETISYRLVGVDETEAERNWVSWQSPIARALLNRRRGDRVRFKFPAGETELEIRDVSYREDA